MIIYLAAVELCRVDAYTYTYLPVRNQNFIEQN